MIQQNFYTFAALLIQKQAGNKYQFELYIMPNYKY